MKKTSCILSLLLALTLAFSLLPATALAVEPMKITGKVGCTGWWCTSGNVFVDEVKLNGSALSKDDDMRLTPGSTATVTVKSNPGYGASGGFLRNKDGSNGASFDLVEASLGSLTRTATFTVPDGDFAIGITAQEAQPVTVNGGTANRTSAIYNDVVTVTATPPAGQKFYRWTSTTSYLQFQNAYASTTTFTMPSRFEGATVTAQFKPQSASAIESVSLNFTKPKAGSSTAITPTLPSGAKYRITGTEISKYDDAGEGYELYTAAAFADKAQYMITFILTPNSSDDWFPGTGSTYGGTATVNGQKANVRRVSESQLELRYYFTLGLTEITSLNVAIPEPVIGQVPTGKASLTTVPAGAAPSEIFIMWFVCDEPIIDFEEPPASMRPMSPNDAFAAGKYYVAALMAEPEPNDGYWYGPDTAITINGRPIEEIGVPGAIFGPLDSAPGLIETVTATQNGSAVKVTWTASKNAAQYELQRQVNGGAWTAVSSALTGLTYNDTGVTAGKTYTYRVRGRNSDGSGQWKTGTAVTVAAPPVAVTRVTLDKTSVELTEGKSVTLTETVSPTNATNKAVTWSSDNTGVATVDANGNVKAVKPGTATITVKTKDGGKTATCKVTVKAKTIAVTGVKLDKTTAELTEGNSVKLKATVSPANATNKAITWSSSNTGVATVDANGNVKAVKPGTATITVKTKDGGKTATCKVTVKAKTVAVTGVKLDKTSAELTEGNSVKLTAKMSPTNATNKAITWSSSNTGVATVDAKGNVKAVKPGTATITVKTKDGGKTATCKVTVKAKTVAVTGVKLDKTTAELTEGNSVKLKATVSPANATNKAVTWSSSNTKVATVDSKGNVKGVKAGTAKITVKTKDGGKTAICTVTVKAKSTPVKVKNGWYNEGGFKYYKNGKAYTGWHKMGKAEGEKTEHWSYFGKDGKIYTGWRKMGKNEGEKIEHWSYFGPNGWLRTGLQQMGKGTNNPDGENPKHKSYFGTNGWLVVNKKFTVAGKTYSADARGWVK